MKNSKLIADFMELPKYGENEIMYNGGIWDYSNMRWDTSWEWLMPVILKIKSLGYYDRDRFPMGFVFEGKGGYFRAQGYNKKFKFGSCYNHPKSNGTVISNVYLTVVDAIKAINSREWYGSRYEKKL